jgi:hypothetical protein
MTNWNNQEPLVPRDPLLFFLNPGSARAGAFTEADQTREGDGDVGGVVQAVQGLSGWSHGAGKEPKYGVNFSLVHPNTP